MKWQLMDELKEVVDLLVKAFPDELGHIKSSKMLFANFSMKKSKVKGRIVPISPRYEIFLADSAYLLEVHKESWVNNDEGFRLYLVYHELKHIPLEGFDSESKQYKKTIEHDLQDFKKLVKDYGVDMEKVEKLVEQVRAAERE